MIERLLIVVLLGVVGVAAYRLYTCRQLAQALTQALIDPIVRDLPAGIPAIVYFTTPTCAPCHLQQTPTLQRVQAEMGEDRLSIIRVDATEHPEIAERWGVFSVPTLFILDPERKPRTVYNGIVDTHTLKRELQV